MQKSFMMKSYSEDSICSDEGMIIMKQFKRMVVMIMSENMGWTWMWMVAFRIKVSASVPVPLDFGF